jgi:hypothetical protein
MSRLTGLIRERRGRQKNPDRTVAIFHIFFDPVTKAEAKDLPRTATVIGGPRLQQEPTETAERFGARVMAVAHQLGKEHEQAN